MCIRQKTLFETIQNYRENIEKNVSDACILTLFGTTEKK